MTITTAVLLTILAVAPDDKALTGDRLKVQGTWTCKITDVADLKLEIEGENAIVTSTPANNPETPSVVKGQFKIDEKAQPKTWDFVNGKTPDGSNRPDLKAIYELKDDTLTICASGPGGERPKSVDEVPAGNRKLVFTRVKKDATKPAK